MNDVPKILSRWAERSQAILAQMRELAELNPQVKREIDVCSLLDPVLSAVNGNNAKFRSRLRVDYSQINEAMPPTLKTSPLFSSIASSDLPVSGGVQPR